MDTTAPESTQPTEEPTQQPVTLEQPVQQEQITTPASSDQSEGTPPPRRFMDHKLYLPIISIVIVLLIIAIAALLFGRGNSNKNQTATITPTPQTIKQTAKPTPKPQQSQALVYGTWTSQSSVIRSVDLNSGSITTLATLPLTIKKVTPLSSDSLIYIDQTDPSDHGQRISVYNIQQKQITTNIPAAAGYGIDDYVLSPNKRFLAIWEVAFSAETHMLQGGLSRVYLVDLTQPAVSTLLYDETITTTIPIHYPRAVLNDGTIFTDQFIPNDPKGGAGWAYGMSIVDFDGTNKQDVTSMPNGTYGSQPSLSSDGKFLLFAGYDGSNGDGTAVKNGYRQALLTPNTVELLDTKTLQRFKLSDLPPSNTYSDAQWDRQTGNVLISILSQDTKQMGLFSYDLSKLHATQIPLPLTNGAQYSFISQLTDTKNLVGIQNTDPANLGNLGQTYAYAYTQVAILDNTGKLSTVSVADPFVQYVAILPGNYFKTVLGAQTKAQSASPAVTYAVLQGNNNKPQDYTFFLKTTLASVRLQEKSNPSGKSAMLCQNLGNTRCSTLGLKPNSSAFTACQNSEKATSLTTNACY